MTIIHFDRWFFPKTLKELRGQRITRPCWGRWKTQLLQWQYCLHPTIHENTGKEVDNIYLDYHLTISNPILTDCFCAALFFQLLFHTILTRDDATAQESLNAAVKDITFGYSFHICELCCAIPIAHSCLISELWIVMNCNYKLTHVNTTLHFMVYNMHDKLSYSLLECMHKLHDLLGKWQHFLVLERSVMAVWFYAVCI